jgi:hypothetical protein
MSEMHEKPISSFCQKIFASQVFVTLKYPKVPLLFTCYATYVKLIGGRQMEQPLEMPSLPVKPMVIHIEIETCALQFVLHYLSRGNWCHNYCR